MTHIIVLAALVGLATLIVFGPEVLAFGVAFAGLGLAGLALGAAVFG